MELQIQGKCMPLTESIRSYATEKFTRLSHRFDRAINIHLWLGVDGKDAQQKEASATIHVKGKELRLERREDNLYTAIDKLAEACSQALCREKEKRSRQRWKAMAVKEARRAGVEGEVGSRGAALAAPLASREDFEPTQDETMANQEIIGAPKLERATRRSTV